MTYTVEVLLRETARVISETVSRDDSSPGDWSDEDVSGVLEGMLGAVARAKDPGNLTPAIVLRGFSWIVNAVDSGVVIAIEIPSGSVVAGPFEIDQERLSSMVARVIAGSASGSEVVH